MALRAQYPGMTMVGCASSSKWEPSSSGMGSLDGVVEFETTYHD